MPAVVYGLIVAFLAGLAGGWRLTTWRWDASLTAAADARYVAIVKARDTDFDLQRIATARGASTEAALQFQRGKAHAIQTAIAARLAQLPVCAVPADVVGLLNAAAGADAAAQGPGPARQPGPPEPNAVPARPAAAEVDSTAARELAVCALNYAEVCTPNAIERDELRALYNEIKARINGPP